MLGPIRHLHRVRQQDAVPQGLRGRGLVARGEGCEDRGWVGGLGENRQHAEHGGGAGEAARESDGAAGDRVAGL